MATATRTETASAGLHARASHPADSHDLIRVHGARENNLKDLHVELPKRRPFFASGRDVGHHGRNA